MYSGDFPALTSCAPSCDIRLTLSNPYSDRQYSKVDSSTFFRAARVINGLGDGPGIGQHQRFRKIADALLGPLMPA